MNLREVYTFLCERSLTEVTYQTVEFWRTTGYGMPRPGEPDAYSKIAKAIFVPKETSEYDYRKRIFTNFAVIVGAEVAFLVTSFLGVIETTARAIIFGGQVGYATGLDAFTTVSDSEQERLNDLTAASYKTMKQSFNATIDSTFCFIFLNLRV
ncbi:MAG: hypothetical protein HKM07_07525 [Chlamydiae bacterium]|jgi:hypothetical protein|nr:hypothetical protein [Chlamydiota bacterium]